MRYYNPSDDELVRLVRRAASAKSAPFALVQVPPGVRVFVARERDLHAMARSTWYAGIQAGRYPAPVKLGERCAAWRSSDIDRLVKELVGVPEIQT